MSNEIPRIYWDSCVFLSYVNGMPDRVRHIEPMLRQSRKDFQIMTSVFSIVEVAFGLKEQESGMLDQETENKINQLWGPESPVQMVELYQLILEEAKQLMRMAIINKWSLKPGDAIRLATASRFKVQEFHTYDDRLDKYAGNTTNHFTISRPIATQPQL